MGLSRYALGGPVNRQSLPSVLIWRADFRFAQRKTTYR
jgi:hypothetical protein